MGQSTENSEKNQLFPPLNKLPLKTFKEYLTPLEPTWVSYGAIQDKAKGTSTVSQNSTKTKTNRLVSTLLISLASLVFGLVLILILIRSHDARWSPSPSTLKQEGSAGFADIQIPLGTLRGYRKLSREGREFIGFYKVPYAEPPVGHLRFKDPVPPSPWNQNRDQVRDETVLAPQCIQRKDSGEVVGEEDCLYANIYTPQLPPSGSSSNSKLFPVMVYFHGGSLSQGYASRYGADYFMDEDVVLVTFQFRLGAFGWLSTGDGVIRGSMGAKDQIRMLNWIQDNIHHFNGDRNSVTVFGNSGGGIFVGELMLSPMSEGLFHRVISQSGVSLALFNLVPNGITEVNQNSTLEQVGSQLNCKTENSSQFLECMKDKPAEDIARLAAESPELVFSYTLEEWEGPSGDKFMEGTPSQKKLLYGDNRTGSEFIMKVPYLIGNVNAEYYAIADKLLKDPVKLQGLNDNFAKTAAEEFMLGADFNSTDYDRLKQFYFGNGTISDDKDSLISLGDLISDRQHVHPAYSAARNHAKFSRTYLYWITKPPPKSYNDKWDPGFQNETKAMGLELLSHADELQYLFPYDAFPFIGTDDQEHFQFSRFLVRLWVHFARTGNLDAEGLELKWPEVSPFGNGTANSTFWMELGDSKKISREPQQRMEFWDQFDNFQLKYDWDWGK